MKFTLSFLICFTTFGLVDAVAQNPFILDQFTADPSARVFNGKVYVYPSHDVPCKDGQGHIGFCMEDYHVYSSENLVQWKDHGVILDQKSVDWVDASTYSMWAPDCIYKNDKYYFYFPAISNEKKGERRIGVATADKPEGPFTPEPNFIKDVAGIDPNPFIDNNGQAYLYWGAGEELYVAKLQDNMLELASEPEIIKALPPKFKEGAYMFERKGKYYFTFPHVPNKTEKLVYAIGDSPMGPFTYTGIIMDESPIGCWTNHHSIIEFKEQWYLFYHHNDLSPDFDKNRSIKIERLYFNDDGTIKKITPTLRGVGITPATNEIQMDRYSSISDSGVSISFLDNKNKKKGWITTLIDANAWVQYNDVNFDNSEVTKGTIKLLAPTGGTLQIRVDSTNGPLLSVIDIKKTSKWKKIAFSLTEKVTGTHNLVMVLKSTDKTTIDWVRFE